MLGPSPRSAGPTGRGAERLALGDGLQAIERTQGRTPVADTGKGIAAEEVDRLFDPFETGSSDYNSLAQSAGLGLSIVKQLVEAHAGEVCAESEPGVGSTFTITLPLTAAEAPECPPESSRRVVPEAERYVPGKIR